jgi:hypothetical protein
MSDNTRHARAPRGAFSACADSCLRMSLRLIHGRVAQSKDPGGQDRRWWSQTGSNRRPPACKAGALPTELWPQVGGWLANRSSRQPAQASPFGLRRATFASLRERRLVGLGRFELPTSRLSSARSNQLSYRPKSTRLPSAVLRTAGNGCSNDLG